MTQTTCMLLTNPVTNDPRVRREAASLVKAGYRVVVVGVKTEEEDLQEEWLDGYKIIRIAHPRLLLGFLLGLKRAMPGLYGALRRLYRLLRYGRQTDVEGAPGMSGRSASFVPPEGAFARLWADLKTIIAMVWLNVALARRAMQQHAEVYHAHDLDTLLAGYLAKVLTGTKLVYDFHELYTEQFDKGVKTELWHTYYLALEWLLAKRTDLRLTVCDSLGEWVCRRYRVRSVVTVKNVPPFQERPVLRAHERTEPVIVYQGLYFRDRGLEQVIECARYLKRGRVVFRGYGYLEDRLRALVKELGVEEKVSFAPPVPMIDLVKAAAEADIGVAPFVPVCLNTRFCLPNKLFEYMMAGLAIAGSDLPEMRNLILGHRLGAVFRPNDPRDMARVLNELLADDGQLERMKRNALFAARTLYNWENEEKALLKAYETLALC